MGAEFFQRFSASIDIIEKGFFKTIIHMLRALMEKLNHMQEQCKQKDEISKKEWKEKLEIESNLTEIQTALMGSSVHWT